MSLIIESNYQDLAKLLSMAVRESQRWTLHIRLIVFSDFLKPLKHINLLELAIKFGLKIDVSCLASTK